MSPGVCRRWHRRLWDGGKLVASQGRNNTTLLTNSTTINTNTATSNSVRPNTWSTAQDWFATRFRFLEAGLYHSTPSNKTSRYFKNVPMKYFANKWKKETWPKQGCICSMHGFFATNIDHLLIFLVPFWKIIYQMLSAEWCARLCQDWSCRHHWRWSERHLTFLVNNIPTWCQELPLYFFVCRLPRDL